MSNFAPTADGEIVRMAPDVPSDRATRSGETAPLPTLAQAPSPIEGYQGIFANADQRWANSLIKGEMGSLRSMSFGRVCLSTPRAASSSGSQSMVWTSSMPLPEAIAIEAADEPHRRRSAYSANPIHWATRSVVTGCVSWSQRILAGQYDEWKAAPTRSWTAGPRSDSRVLAWWAERRSAHIRRGVAGRPAASTPIRLCQKQEEATAAISLTRPADRSRQASMQRMRR